MNATALYTPDKCEVWCPTQNGEAALAAAAEAAGLPVAKCEVNKLLLGGGFGRRGRADYVRQAVLDRQADAGHAGQADLVARRGHDARHLPPDHAVQADRRARRTRATSSACTCASPASRSSPSLAPQSLQNGMDPATFQGLNAGGPEGAFGYNVPNLLIDHAMRNPHVPPGFWRGVNINQNAIYIECFIDELAHAAGQDPLEFRRKLMLKPEAPRGAERGRRRRRAGASRRRRASFAASRRSWASAATSRRAPRSRSTATAS